MKRIIAIICLVSVLALALAGCGNRIEKKSAKLEAGMTYEKAVDILGKKGEMVESDDIVYSWDCGDGKTLYVWLTVPYDDHDHIGIDHDHSYNYPDEFVIKKFEIVDNSAEEQ